MPNPFRDAVAITKVLGARYLWIDVLRILQDSIEDWRYKASKMSGVYENAIRNIATRGVPQTVPGGINLEQRP